MNAEQARTLVLQTFPKPFDKSRFRNFAINLLHEIDESKAQSWNTTYVKDAFKPHIKGYQRLGTYTSPDNAKLDVLVVHLTAASKLERARTAMRNFVAHHLKTRDNKDAALVAFVSPTEAQWRLSYVKMEYAAIQKDDGKVGVQTTLTPARRSSYIVGEGESCHTALSRFLHLLQDTDNLPTLAQVEDAFSVEAVTKEFFEQYKALFLDLKDELDDRAKKEKAVRAEFAAKKVSTTDFAKKLMGQIVFLYFLQKKGWLGVPKTGEWGDGPHNFLRQLFDGKFGAYRSFFNDALEPLFYDTLATDRGHDAWCETLNCRIPFLNGGLFEPLAGYDWQNTDIVVPNSLFSNTKATRAGDNGTGILDVFDRYNFTVNEAEPLEKEVAIDPEMLGKVFENLLEVKERKSKGSFYTPREIVHYMCQESLINYLDTALNNTKQTVPRKDIETFIHSGDQASHYEAARLDGTGYRRELPKTIESHARPLDDKLADIAVCDPAIGSGAFPVGMMQEIVRARAVLTPYFNDVRDRTTYHFKRHAIQDCLYGVDIDPGAVEIAKLRLWLSLVVDEDDVKQIKPLPNLDYKIVAGNSLLGVEKNLFNADLFERLEELKPRYFDATDRKQKEGFKREIDNLIHKLTNDRDVFDFEIYFSEIMDDKRRSGFDAVIGNPPYVRQEAITALKPLLSASYECFDGRADLYVYFYERGVKLLKANGVLSFISSNKFFRAGYGENLRDFLSHKTQLHRLIDFGDLPVFEATVYPCVVITQKANPTKAHDVRILRVETESELAGFVQLARTRSTRLAQQELGSSIWQLEGESTLALLSKIRSAGKPLGEVVNQRIYAGIKTGLNDAFVIDSATRSNLVGEDAKGKEIIKPFIKGKDINKWLPEVGDRYIIYAPHGVAINEYPAIKRHLGQFKEALRERALDQDWFELQQPQLGFTKEFGKTKIVYPNVSLGCRFALDTGSYLDMTSFCICSSSLFLLAILNSSIMSFYFSHVGIQRRGGYQEFKTQYVKELPIPVVPTENEKPLERIVQRILSVKQRDAGGDVSTLEQELDDLVYSLYGLTEEEIALVQAVSADPQ